MSFANRLNSLWLVGASIALLVIGGCSTGAEERRWTEEVAIEPGKSITIERSVRFKETNSWAGDAYNAILSKSVLSFRGDLAPLPSWDVPLVPLLLYRDTASGEWTIVATTSSCDVWADRGSPSHMYWEFRLRDGRWIEADLSPASIGRPTNLFFNYEPGIPDSHISVARKEGILSENNFGKNYRRVLGDYKSNCTRRI
jgi:hypothetical protein